MELEEIMEKLEETVMTMEHEKLSLEEAYATFSRGMKLVVEGNKAIDQVEKKVQILLQHCDQWTLSVAFCRTTLRRPVS